MLPAETRRPDRHGGFGGAVVYGGGVSWCVWAYLVVEVFKIEAVVGFDLGLAFEAESLNTAAAIEDTSGTTDY